MRNTQRKFFTNNWIILGGELGLEAAKRLGVDKYYTNLIDVSNIEELLTMSEEELTRKISSSPSEVKETLGYCFASLIEDGTLSDLNKIRLFEKVLNTKLLEA